jgi:hypothetical protein
MRNLIPRLMVALLAVLAFSTVAMAQAVGPGTKASLYTGNALNPDPTPGGPAPVHDVFGSWAGPLEPEHPEVPPLTALGQKLFSLNRSERQVGTARSNDPLKTCDPLGFPRNLSFETRGINFAQMPGKIVVLHQYQRVWRDVWMDGRELPKNLEGPDGPGLRWYGYSVGHWDGDYTLVIDTVGSDSKSWLDTNGHPHSVDMKVEERYTRVDHNHLQMSVTVDDPKVYTKPFVLSTALYRWIPDQGADEQICVPSEAITYTNIISDPAFGIGAGPKDNQWKVDTSDLRSIPFWQAAVPRLARHRRKKTPRQNRLDAEITAREGRTCR